ncbi:MAG TPA: CBS domain-containing protein, partial [Kofleriaceae bacterium]|nr:CBS domain-containing protein [Kofleriaceae bacterium]
MSSSDENVPEPVRAGTDLSTEVSTLPPEQRAEVIAEIRAVAEQRGEDSEVVELVELPATGRARRPSSITLPPMPSERATPPPEPGAKVEEEPLSPDELRDAWPLLDLEERSDGLRVMPREDAEEFFIALSAHDQAKLVLHFRPGQRRQWMRMLEPDDVADVIQDAGDQHKQTFLALLDDPTRKEVLALLAYAEDEAGGLMSTRFARLRPNMTAGEALSYLQRQARAKLETIYVAYVIDMDQRLHGVVSFRELFAAEPKKLVSEIMETDVVRVTEDMDQETVSRLFAEHDLNVIPVVDANGKMKGIVTVDDIVDVVQEEATEDAQKFGGMEALEVPYLQSSRREMIKKRIVWLIILLAGSMLTATALESFQG